MTEYYQGRFIEIPEAGCLSISAFKMAKGDRTYSLVKIAKNYKIAKKCPFLETR